MSKRSTSFVFPQYIPNFTKCKVDKLTFEICFVKGLPYKPNEMVWMGRGGASKREKFLPQAETETSGLCDDEDGADLRCEHLTYYRNARARFCGALKRLCLRGSFWRGKQQGAGFPAGDKMTWLCTKAGTYVPTGGRSFGLPREMTRRFPGGRGYLCFLLDSPWRLFR